MLFLSIINFSITWGKGHIANISRGGDRRSNQTANLQFENTRAEFTDQLNVSERSVNTAGKVKEKSFFEI